MPSPKKQTLAERNKKRRNRRENRRKYTPVLCKQCKQEIRQMILVEFEAPLGWNDFTKDGLCAAFVKVLGPRWEDALWSCACGEKQPTQRDARTGPKKRTKTPKAEDRE